MCHAGININYSEKELIECCNLIAEDLGVPRPNSKDVLDKLTEVLVKRESYVSMKNGLITKDELAYLIFQHLDSLARKGLASSYSRAYTKEGEINVKIKQALFHNAT